MTRALMLASAVMLAGCVNDDWTTGRSFVASLDAADAPVVSKSVADFVKQRVPVAGPISLQSAEGDTALGPVITADLEKMGYPSSPLSPHKVGFAVQPYDSMVLTMVTVDDAVGTRLFGRDPSTHLLRPQGPMSIREPAQ